MKETKDEVIDVEAYIAQREKEAAEKGEPKPRIRPNVNYTSFVLNEVEDVDLEYTGKNEVLEIKLLDSKGTEIKYGQKIHNNEEYTYEVIKLDEQDKNNIEKDLKNIKWCFWIPEITGFEIELAKNFIANTNKAEHTTDFLSGLTSDTAKMKAIKQHGILYGKKEIVEKEGKKTAILKVKFSKWLDSYTIKVEAYLSGKKGKGDSVATRWLTVNPEILDAYWLNAAGRKVTNTGYKQDVYLYLKTLGLKGKTLEIQVFDKDKHPNPAPITGTDDLVEWKNNKIKIESRETIKQFKVGDKERYKEAQKDEAAESDAFMGLYDFNKARIYTLELYIHIANTAALNLKDADPQNKYGLLNLYPREEIINAFFAKTETEKVQADAPEIKDEKTGKSKLPPKAEVPYYKKLNHGVIGQKIQLVAECANLEEKEVIFKIYEREKLLVEKNKRLPVIQNNTEVTEIKATVKNGYVVAEIELQKVDQGKYADWDTKLDPAEGELKISNLYIKVGCEDADFTVVGRHFLEGNSKEFKLMAAKIIQNIYHNGTIDKVDYTNMQKVEYIYHDSNKNKHNICECKLYETWQMGSGNQYTQPTSSQKSLAAVTDYSSMGVVGVNAHKTYLLANNDVFTKGDLVAGYTHLYYKASTKKIKMIVLPSNGINYTNGNLAVKFEFKRTLRKYSHPVVFAAFIGVLAECSFTDVISEGSSYEDGSSYPSKTHNNGFAIDTWYFGPNRDVETGFVSSINLAKQQSFIDAFKNFGFKERIKGTASKHSSLTNHTGKNGKHNGHLHCGKVTPNYKK